MAKTIEEIAKQKHEQYLKYKASGKTKIYQKTNRIKHRDKRNTDMKDWHARHKEHDLAYARNLYKTPKRKAQCAIWCKEYREANKEKIAKRSKTWREENKDKLKVKRVAYYQSNKDKIKAQIKAYRQTPAGKASEKKYHDKVRATPHGQLRHNISSAVRLKLLNHGGKKYRASIDKVLPFKIKDLITRLESMFKPGMTWENYGDWHVDHIRPDISFNYATVDEPEFAQSWALTNLQPLWASENCSKGSR